MKAKKTTKSKKATNSLLRLTNIDYEKDAKAVVALFALLLAMGVLLLFNNYKDQIIMSDNFQLFMILAVVCMALLIGLLFLVSKPHRK